MLHRKLEDGKLNAHQTIYTFQCKVSSHYSKLKMGQNTNSKCVTGCLVIITILTIILCVYWNDAEITISFKPKGSSESYRLKLTTHLQLNNNGYDQIPNISHSESRGHVNASLENNKIQISPTKHPDNQGIQPTTQNVSWPKDGQTSSQNNLYQSNKNITEESLGYKQHNNRTVLPSLTSTNVNSTKAFDPNTKFKGDN